MSEETTQVKISMPLIDDIELQRIDTFYNDIVSEYIKAFVKEKEQVIIQRLMMKLQQENQQLKEVIEEVREEVENSSLEVNTREYGTLTVCNSDNLLQILDKVKENKNGC